MNAVYRYRVRAKVVVERVVDVEIGSPDPFDTVEIARQTILTEEHGVLDVDIEEVREL